MNIKHQTTTKWDEALWRKAELVYNEAFPEHGRKKPSIIRRMFERGLCTLHTWTEGNDVAAMALTAINAGVLIIDYIAVRRDKRGQGWGRACIQDIRDWAQNTAHCHGIVIEVEAEPTQENAERIQFWQQVGFRLTDYVHPYIWVPETYRAMYMNLDAKAPLNDDGRVLFKYITDYHEKAYRGK
jgi:GNAT superfamily N-acetyltransferase